MSRRPAILFSIVALAFLSGCGEVLTTSEPPPTPRPEAVSTFEPQIQVYTNTERGLTFNYPLDWVIKEEIPDRLVLVPRERLHWKIESPRDFPYDPRVKIELAEWVYTPYIDELKLSPEIMRPVFEKGVQNGTHEDFSETIIGDYQTFKIIERTLPGCFQTTYWRLTGQTRQVKVYTGCESPYMNEYEVIVESLRDYP